MNPHWTPPTGTDAKLGRLDAITTREVEAAGTAAHEAAAKAVCTATRIGAEWLPFMPGTRQPFLPAALLPGADVDGWPAEVAHLREVGEWRLAAVMGGWFLRHFPAFPNGVVNAVAFSPDGRLGVTVGPIVRLWDLVYGRQIRQLGFGESWRKYTVPLAFDGRYMVCQNRRTAWVEIWDWHTGKSRSLTRDVRPTCRGFGLSPDGTRCVIVGGDYLVNRNLANGSILNTELDGGHVMRETAFSRDLARVAVSDAGEIRLFDTAENRFLGGFATGLPRVERLAMTADGERLVSVGPDARLRVWSASGKRIGASESHDAMADMTAFALAADGSIAITGHKGGAVWMWDLQSGTPTRTAQVNGHFRGVYSAAISPDATRVLLGTKGGTALHWDLRTNAPLMPAAQHSHTITMIDLSHDGRLLASASADRTAKIWETATGRLLHDLTAHGNAVLKVIFSADARIVHTFSIADEWRAWDVATRACLGPSARPLRQPRPQTTFWPNLSPINDWMSLHTVSADGSTLAMATMRGALLAYTRATADRPPSIFGLARLLADT